MNEILLVHQNQMVILERNIRLLLQSVAYKTMKQPAKASDIAIIVITVIIFVIFLMGLGSICSRWSFRSFESINWFTESDVAESRTVSARMNTEALGIDAAILKSFPTFLYSEVKERRIGIGGAECAVCLCEFEDDETLRLMPNCCHVFHADCVSVWLYDHSTCPLCRVELVFQPGEGSDLVPDSDSTYVHLLEGVTWANRNRPYQSKSTRLSHCRVSEILLSRCHSTGHYVVQPIENFERFKLRLPEDVWRQLTKKTVGHVALNQVRSLQRHNRSRSAGSERGVFSYQRNNYSNRRLHSKSFSFSDCNKCPTSCGEDTVALPKSLPRSDERSFERFQPTDRL